MMNEKEVILIRKQATPFKVNYPIDGRIKTYVWNGTRGKLLNKKSVPFEVYEWLSQYTTTFPEGCLIIDQTEDHEVNEIKGNIKNVDLAEKSVLTQEEIKEILTSGNHLALKSKLKNITEDMPENIKNNQRRHIITVAREIGIDSSAKRRVLAEWANLDVENSDLIFDKELLEMYDKEE